MAGRRIRRAIFSNPIEYLKCIKDELFIVSRSIIHILNMYGLIVEDVRLPPGVLKEIFRFGDLIFIRMNRHEYHYFKLGETSLTRLNFSARVMKAGTSLIFSNRNILSVLEVPALKTKHLITMPNEIVDFVELKSDIYILFKNHLCSIQKPLSRDEKTVLRPVECLSHLTFTSMGSNGDNFLVLESLEELVVYGGNMSFWLVAKPHGYHGYEVSELFLILLSDDVELYNLNDGKRFAKFYTKTKIISHDSCRRKLWIYSNSLYEIDITKPFK